MPKKLVILIIAAAIGVVSVLGLNALGFRFPALVAYGIVGFVSAAAAVLLTQRR